MATSNFNYLSGSSIDNNTNLMFDLFLSGKCYIGFTRGERDLQWGTNALVSISIAGVNDPGFNIYDVMAETVDQAAEDKFFDLRTYESGKHAFITPSNDALRSVFILRTPRGLDPATDGVKLKEADIGNLYLSYMNTDWAVIKGFTNKYYDYMPLSASGGVPGDTYYDYYITNDRLAATGQRVKILTKTYAALPFYATKANLYIQPNSTGNFQLLCSGLQKVVNILGEIYVTGVDDTQASGMTALLNDLSTSVVDNKLVLKNAKFALRDLTDENLIDNLDYVDQEVGNTSGIYTINTVMGATNKYIVFRYKFTDTALNSVTQSDYQYIKMMVGPNSTDEIGIWNENYPFTTENFVADRNPPALDVSYLKSASINSSIFDVRGMSRINAEPVSAADFWFVKQCFSNQEAMTASGAGLTIKDISLDGPMTVHLGATSQSVATGTRTIPLNNFHNFVVGDLVWISREPVSSSPLGETYLVEEVSYVMGQGYIKFSTGITLAADATIPTNYTLYSTPTSSVAKITLAMTHVKSQAIKFGCTNIMIEKEISHAVADGDNPVDNTYRQIFVSYDPRNASGGSFDPTLLASDTIRGSGSNLFAPIFNQATRTEDVGAMFYLANSIAIDRSIISSPKQQFKLII